MRLCTECRLEKPLEDFTLIHGFKLSLLCKECRDKIRKRKAMPTKKIFPEPKKYSDYLKSTSIDEKWKKILARAKDKV